MPGPGPSNERMWYTMSIAANQTRHCGSIAHRTWHIAGQVQGVGFRPLVVRLAREHGIAGTVRNDPGGVTIEAWGTDSLLDLFIQDISARRPALASIESIDCLAGSDHDEHQTGHVPTDFTIVDSEHGSRQPGRVTIDSGTCSDCVRELFDPQDRRYRHALINCTNCGPRYTIIRDLPYDRPRTTMADFAMCTKCEREYADQTDRRFHAQPTCCPECGPQVRFETGTQSDTEAPFAQAVSLLAEGGVLAMKGLGGYHLVADATNERAVQRLRTGKRRDSKPFAVMAPDLDAARALAHLSPAAERALLTPAAPIVLAERRVENRLVAPSVTAGCHRLGVMLPYTAMQHLLFAEPAIAGRPLVMTSANLSNDPLIKDDDAARTELAEIADGFLTHDRPILRAVDDSIVAESNTNGLVPIRMARGYVPVPIALPEEAPCPGLCTGGELKNTVAVIRQREAILSQHIGDLTHPRVYQRFEQTITDLLRLYEVAPAWVACDLHPRYMARRHARALARQYDVPLIEIQHHHAHLASIAAEHGVTEPIIGLICDGVGYGSDGEAWGGEILIGNCRSFQRIGRLKPLRLPGGDAAARDATRCAVSWLFDSDLSRARVRHHIARLLPDQRQRTAILSLLESNLSCPLSSGMGRLFDAAAAILNVCTKNEYEAMSGLLMEAAASRADSHPTGTDLIKVVEPDADGHDALFELDATPLLSALLTQYESAPDDPGPAAWMVHDAIADGLSRAAVRASQESGMATVGLSGGVFCNVLLTQLTAERLRRAGLAVLVHRRVPPNDGGLAYGQAAITAARIAHSPESTRL